MTGTWSSGEIQKDVCAGYTILEVYKTHNHLERRTMFCAYNKACLTSRDKQKLTLTKVWKLLPSCVLICLVVSGVEPNEVKGSPIATETYGCS